jgi:uroporphyrinogen-III synthase
MRCASAATPARNSRGAAGRISSGTKAVHLLLTRAEPGASISAEHLRRLGHQVIVEPMLRIEHLPEPADLPAPAALVLTSTNGVRALSSWPASARWRELPVFVIGSATAEACRAAGYRRIRSADGNADALLKLIAEELDPRSGMIIYAVAEVTATDLQSQLARSGYSLRRVVAYRAIPATKLSAEARHALASRALNAALVYSERAAATFAERVALEGLADSMATVDLIALSAEVARPLAPLSPRRLLVAARPDENALFACLE